MSVDRSPSSNPLNDAEAEQKYFEWLETHIRDREELRRQQQALSLEEPEVFLTVIALAAELSDGNPRAHATHVGSFLLLLSEMEAELIA